MKIFMTLALATALVTTLTTAKALAEPKNLLIGTVPGSSSGNEPGAEAQELSFILVGENRQDIIGGEIKLGERAFTIEKISRLGTIGASRSGPHSDSTSGRYAEYAIFSSSFSGQTATGQPWVASKVYITCDQAYNSFLAIYHLNDSSAVEKFAKSPYAVLAEDVEKSDDSIVYCFNSKPPA